MCGEQNFIQGIFKAFIGSPPRVRGTGQYDKVYRKCTGITPACAGNRMAVFGFSAAMRDHPRVCGEQQAWVLSDILRAGSPPRVRGTVRGPCGGQYRRGITPACAGNSYTLDGRAVPDKDHPRVCGEQKPPSSEWKHSIGSPPRVRGTVSASVKKGKPRGITPACAGNS